jgi:hypothetical protein
MKKMILSVVAFLAISSQAFAFFPQVQYFVNNQVAVARVMNTTFQPMVCSGQAFGRTFQGMVLTSWINNAVIYPNTFTDVYVYSNVYDPMAQAWAQIDCQILY